MNKVSMSSKGCTVELLKKLYHEEQKTIKEMANIFGVAITTIRRWMDECEIKVRDTRYVKLYDFNENYFDVIDSDEKAYWLGFIWCDSYASIRKRGKHGISYDFKLVLQDSDEDHIRKFCNSIGFEKELKHEKSSTGHWQWRIDISNRHFVKTLCEKHGLTPHRKYGYAEELFNNVPYEYHKSLIRGFIDADGTISYYEYNDSHSSRKKSVKHRVAISTCKSLVEFTQQHFLSNELISRERTIRHTSGSCYICQFDGKNQVLRILRYLYKDEKPFLDRKMKKYIELENGDVYNE